MNKIYIQVRGALPSYVEWQSTLAEDVYVAQVDARTEDKLRGEPNIRIVKIQPIF